MDLTKVTCASNFGSLDKITAQWGQSILSAILLCKMAHNNNFYPTYQFYLPISVFILYQGEEWNFEEDAKMESVWIIFDTTNERDWAIKSFRL